LLQRQHRDRLKERRDLIRSIWKRRNTISSLFRAIQPQDCDAPEDPLMKASRYNLFVPDGEAVYAVNLLSRTAITLSPQAYEAYQEMACGEAEMPAPEEAPELHEFEQMLRTGLFLLDDDFDELAYIRYRVQQERFDTRQLGLVITPTMGCNFSCHYCFENKTDSFLSEEAQNRLIRLVASNLAGREHLSVQWFGGEPLQALPIIENLSRNFMRLAQTAGVAYAATVITNGYLMTEEVSQRLAELGVTTVQISLDGDKHLHDRTRFERPGAGSFEKILEHIRLASPHLSVKLRVHVAPFNVDSVRHLIDTLGQRQIAPHVAELYFAPLFNYRQAMPGQAYQSDGKRFMNSEQFAGTQIELLQRAAAWGFAAPDFLEVSYGICTAVRNNTLVVDADGNLMKCYKDVGVSEEATGSLSTGPQANRNLLKWMDIQIPRDDECRECRFLPICLGGCTKQWHEGASKGVICTPLKYNAEEMIRHYFTSDAPNLPFSVERKQCVD
jgi:uncharacterized protein